MTPGDRVRFDDPVHGPALGTVLRVSPAGYAVVCWDDGTEGRLSPRTAAALTVVTGDDARRRHDWTDGDVCARCLVAYAADRAGAPCFGLHPDGVR